ncbi:MAG TPA: hypothetical protein VMU11_04545 [Verrucomicrobiae bacterium]|nr:hypothetical protein [Verrucomicrobiae bacterium]
MNPTPNQPLAEKVLEQIEEKQVAPRPRWVFLAKNIAFWSLWVLSLLIGAAALAATLFALTNAGWEFRDVTHPEIVSFLMENIPVLWIVALCLMLVLGIENLRHTKSGYRYPMFVLFALNLLGSAALGYGLFRLGAGQFVDEDLGSHIPFHRPMLVVQEHNWTRPQRGLLSGAVTDVDGDFKQFTIKTFDGIVWTVSGADVGDIGRDVLIHAPVVRVVGVPLQEDATNTVFHACFVFPWVVTGGTFPMQPPAPPHTFTLQVPSQEFAPDSPCAQLQTAKELRDLQYHR